MKTYPTSFVLFLQQIAVGGLFALAVTPFQEIERGFYKSTAGVLVVAALLGVWGKVTLFRDASLPVDGVGGGGGDDYLPSLCTIFSPLFYIPMA